MSVLFAATCIIGIICMIVFMFIGIWLFIVALKAFNQLRYKNYILEKINHNLTTLSKKDNFSVNDFDFDDINENNNEDEDMNISSFDNIKNLK